MKKMMFFLAVLLATVALSAQAEIDKRSLSQARGIVVAKAESTLTLNLGGSNITFKISPDLLHLIRAKGDSVHVIVGSGMVKYLVRRISGTCVFGMKNLREDFHMIRDVALDRMVAVTWADSTVQSIGDPFEWIGSKVTWEEVWVTPDPSVAGRYLGYIMR